MRVEFSRSCVNNELDVLLAVGIPIVPAVSRARGSCEIGQRLLVCLGIDGRNKRAGFPLHFESSVEGLI